MKPSLQLRQSQHLALTPQLQQSIRLLQLSTLELQQELQQMLDANPLLELDGDEFEPGVSQLNPPERKTAEDEAPPREERELAADDFGKTEQEDWANGTEGDDFDGIRELPSLSSGAEPDDDGGGDFDAAPPSLSEHLREQMLGRQLSPADRAALLLLIDSLDEGGYLADPLEELVAQLAGDDPEVAEELEERLRIALALLQSMDPAGVGRAV